MTLLENRVQMIWSGNTVIHWFTLKSVAWSAPPVMPLIQSAQVDFSSSLWVVIIRELSLLKSRRATEPDGLSFFFKNGGEFSTSGWLEVLESFWEKECPNCLWTQTSLLLRIFAIDDSVMPFDQECFWHDFYLETIWDRLSWCTSLLSKLESHPFLIAFRKAFSKKLL